MLNVLHGRFVANPAQNSPSHIMKGKKAQMSTVSHWDWIRHPHLTLLIHTRPRSPFLSLSPPSTPLAQKPPAHKHTPTESQQILHPAWRVTVRVHKHPPPSVTLLVIFPHWGISESEVLIWRKRPKSCWGLYVKSFNAVFQKINSCNAVS